MSKGLVETWDRQISISGNASITGASSTKAGVGFFSHGVVVEFIHKETYEFFMSGIGFRKLSSHLDADPITSGHFHILRCCIRYSLLEEMDHLRRKASRYEMDRRKMVEQEVSSLLDRLFRCTQRRRGTQSERDELKEVDTLKKDILSFPKEFTREEFEHLLLSTIASPLLRFAQGYRNSRQIFDELDNSESTSSDSEPAVQIQPPRNEVIKSNSRKEIKHAIHKIIEISPCSTIEEVIPDQILASVASSQHHPVQGNIIFKLMELNHHGVRHCLRVLGRSPVSTQFIVS